MILHCAWCHNTLIISLGKRGSNVFSCEVCDYTYPIEKEYKFKQFFKQEITEKIVKDSDAWANADKTQVTCPKCQHNEAYYKQVQTRSADEPMTIFYSCCKCAHQFRE